ncbi:MAG TPA: tetratricopeptide repeat protein, partial [Opitutales bacterium]|nr:tetratricopeptide repeat protein [Opitutales bacterium]
AAAKLPDAPDVQFEWAVEEHRAREYAAAADTYAKYVKARPDDARAWGLLAECLIRTQQIPAAVDAWQQHEKAKTGTGQELDTLICDVHTPIPINNQRIHLLAKAKSGDIDAMEKLALMDADFKLDWWHGGSLGSLLQKDLEILGNTKFTDQDHVNEIKAVVDFTLAAEALDDVEKVTAALRKYGLLLDDKATLPQSGAVLSALMNTLLSTHILSDKEAREKFGPAILARARATHDAETYNVAAHLYLDTPQLADIDQEGWDATHDVRFAASRIVGLNHDGKLTYDDPLLVKAAKEFPDSAEIAKVVVELTVKAGKPDQAAIIQAIEAEYTHFSLNGSPGRISSEALGGYFDLLGKELKHLPQP